MVGTPVAAYIGPPRGLTKHVSTLGICSKCLVENKIAPGAPFSCQPACLYHGECGGMSCATSRPGPGPGRAGFQLYTFALPLPSWLRTGLPSLSPRRNSFVERRKACTLVCQTCGRDWGESERGRELERGKERERKLEIGKVGERGRERKR